MKKIVVLICCLLTGFSFLMAQPSFLGLTEQGGGGFGSITKYDAATNSLTSLFQFENKGRNPSGHLIKASDGKLYGMTVSGGSSNYGTIFSFDPVTSTQTVLRSFDHTTGSNPYGSLIQASDGKLYGMTLNGGTSGYGVIFSYEPLSASYVVLRNFSNSTGANPYGSLMQASDGKLYGMTPHGGTSGVGVLFSIDPATTIYSVLRNFDNTTGANPYGSLIQASNGKLYGMTAGGGTSGYGVIFSYSPSSATYTVLKDFNYSTGAAPHGSLMQASNGKLYGMTANGGTSGIGVLFSIDPVTTAYSLIRSFSYSTGSYPYGSLIQSNSGNIYGTTYEGGSNGYGVVFSFNPVSLVYTAIKNFDHSEGAWSYLDNTLLNNTDGNLYGLTRHGGVQGWGVLYRIDPSTNSYSKLSDFSAGHGLYPSGSLVKASNGKYYGMTRNGGTLNYGVIFSFDPLSMTYTVVWNFDYSTGGNPYGSLIQASDGKLYGMTTNGGVSGYGVIFSFDPASSTYTVLRSFNNSTGGSPNGSLIQALDGKLYGLTYNGGTSNYGVIFSFDPISLTYTVLKNLELSTGRHAYGSLMQASNGKLYGMTSYGGNSDLGVIFSFEPVSLTYAVVKNLDNTSGTRPFGSLIQANDGNLYGMTHQGGTSGQGVVFSLEPVSLTYNVIKNFVSGTTGMRPFGSLIQGSDGKLYGMTREGGLLGRGTAFSIELGTSVFTKADFNQTNGAYPWRSSLVEMNSCTTTTYYADTDGDGFGDPAQSQSACTQPGGYVTNNTDNCPTVSNVNQLDTDNDGQGDACDIDDDNDGVLDVNDNCPLTSNPSQANNDGDALGDLCDDDDDNDAILDINDCAPFNASQLQASSSVTYGAGMPAIQSMTFNAPGGVTVTGSGIAINGGRTNFYSTVNTVPYSGLWWTFTDIMNPRHSISQPSSTGAMTFSGYDAATGIATWTSTANLVWSANSGTESVATRLRLQFQPNTGSNSGPLLSGWITPVTSGGISLAGLSSNQWPLIDIKTLGASGAYQVWFSYEIASGPSAGMSLGQYYATYPHTSVQGGQIQTSSVGTFYSTVGTCSTGTVVVSATGGATPYTGTGVFVLNAGPQSFTVTDANGCTSITNITVAPPPPIQASATVSYGSGAPTVQPVIFNAPGGVTFSGSGNPISGGRTNIYSTVNTAPYSSMYWTFIDIKNPKHSVNQPASTGDMVFAGYDAATGIATWNSNVNLQWIGNAGLESVPTRLRLQFQPHTGVNNGPLVSGWIVPVTAGGISLASLPSSQWPLIDIKSLGANAAYQVWYSYEIASGPNMGTSLAQYYATYPHTSVQGGMIQTSSTGTFYSTIGSCTTGTVTVTATGGASPYNGTGVFTMNAGSHNFTVTDANGCASTATVNVNPPPVIQASSTVSFNTAGTVGVQNMIQNTDYSFSGSPVAGSQLKPGGRTLFYTNLNTNFGGLWWTYSAIANPRHSTQADIGNMQFSGYDPVSGIATWVSTANMTWPTINGTVSTPTRMRLQLQPHTGVHSGQLANGFIVPVTAGSIGLNSLTPAGWVLNNLKTLGTNKFQVWIIYETPSGTPLDSYFGSSNNTGGQIFTSTTGTFYSSSASYCEGGTQAAVTVTATGGTAPHTGTGTFYVGAGAYSYTVTDANGCSSITTGNVLFPTRNTFYIDADGDGFGSPTGSILRCDATPPAGYSVSNTDCNDGDGAVNQNTVWYLDADGDGFAISTTQSCSSPGTGYTTTVLPVTDCDDNLVSYQDNDGDGFGSLMKVPCNGVVNHDDCDDNLVMYQDSDGDQFGSTVKVPCNGVITNTDCVDNNAAINPNAIETCNGIDDDCDGTADDGFINTVVTCSHTGTVTKNLAGAACTYTVNATEFDATVTQNCGPLSYTLTGATTGTGSSLAGVVFNTGTTNVTWSATNAAGQVISCSFNVYVVPAPPVVNCPTNITVNSDAGVCGAVVNYVTPTLPVLCANNDNLPPTTMTYNYTGQIVSWTVPAGVTSITMEAKGAQGKAAEPGFVGGKGAKMKGEFSVTAGTQLLMLVGEEGKWPGCCSGGGGGGSFIVKVDPSSADVITSGPFAGYHVTPLLIAGGGGGTRAAVTANGNPGVISNYATTGSCASQSGGGVPKNTGLGVGGAAPCYSWGSGGGGFRGNGLNDASFGTGGLSFLNGGTGGLNHCGSGGVYGGFGGGGSGGGCWGGGGGGGYSGGDGGMVAGGGGSYNSGINQVNTSGENQGHGQITITYGSSPAGITQTAGLAPGASFPVGTTTNTFQVTDNFGQTSTCSFTVTVNDTEAPVVTQPANITVSNAPGQCTASVSYSGATATDNCNVTSLKYFLNYTIAPTQITFPRTFAVGSYVVTVEAKDAAGNTTTKNFTVIVNDSEQPVLVKGIIPGCFYDLASAEAAAIAATTMSDNCTTTGNLAVVANTTGTCNAVITVTVTDAALNSQSVVYNTKIDNTAPVFNGLPAQTITVNCHEVPAIPTVTANDNCDGAVNVTFTPSSTKGSNPALASFYNYTITRKWEAWDGCNNYSSFTQTITVQDITAPDLSCQTNISVNAPIGACEVSVPFEATATDNCATPTIRYYLNYGLPGQTMISSPWVFPVGTTTVKVIASDPSGNTSPCSFTVTVTDVEDPTITCPANINLSNTAGFCYNSTINTGTATATDPCGIASIAGVRNDNLALTANYPVGVTTITWTATDNNGRTSTCQQTVTINDTELPHVITTNITRQLSQSGTVTITAAEVNNGSWDNCGIDVSTISVSPSNFNCLNVGQNTVTLTMTDVHGNSNSATAIVNITPLSTVSTVTVTSPKQYSDEVTFTATVTPGQVAGGCQAATGVNFYINTRLMGSSSLTYNAISGKMEGSLTTTLFEIGSTLSVVPGNKTVKAVFTGINGAFTVSDATTPLVVNPEDCRAEFTGSQFNSTPAISIGTPVTIVVPLRMNVQDISVPLSPADPFYDAFNGNISRAKARFIVRETGTPVVTAETDGNGWIPVSLIAPLDSSTGTVAANWTVTLGNNEYSNSFTIDLEIGGPDGYYYRKNPDDKTVVTVSRPSQDFVTGGGNVMPGNGSGQYAPTAGKKINFGFNLKYNKSGKNLQGSVNVVFRRVVNGEVRLFQIKGNSMQSMGVNTSNPNSKLANFTCKANLNDVTDPLNIIGYGGGHTFEVKLTDNGEPGTLDSIAITLYTSSGTLLMSSNWVTINTVQKKIANGNIQVSGVSASSPRGVELSPIVTAPVSFNVEVAPNPSPDRFTIVVRSSNENDAVIMRVLNSIGQVVEIKRNVILNETFQIGERYRPGTYIVELVQGREKRTITLIKQSE